MNVSENVDLSKCTSFGTGGKCEYFAVAQSAEDLVEIIKTQKRPLWLLGRGANSLISDKGLPGTTIHMQLTNISQDDDLVIAEAGVLWDDLVTYAIEQGLWGIELTSGIPSSVGAAVVGNIAAYGQAVSDTLKWIEVIDHTVDEPEVRRLEVDELNMGYRSSAFSNGDFSNYIILRSAFALQKEPTTELKYESATKVAEEMNFDVSTLEGRRSTIMLARERAGSLLDKDHVQKTAGSFFKNPMVSPEQAEQIMEHEERAVTKEQILKQNQIHGGDSMRVSAAHVLLAAGFDRGQSWGPVRLHPDHVLKIENTGGATSQQIYEVSQEIISQVKEKLNIDLEPEVRFLGDFS